MSQPRLPVPCAAGLRPLPPPAGKSRGKPRTSICAAASIGTSGPRSASSRRSRFSSRSPAPPACAGLCRAGRLLRRHGLQLLYRARTGFTQARAALERASQLDPQAPRLASEGTNRDGRGGERAIASNPNYAAAYDWLGVRERWREVRGGLFGGVGYKGVRGEMGYEVDRTFAAHFWMGRVLSSNLTVRARFRSWRLRRLLPLRLAARHCRSRPHSGCMWPAIASAGRPAAADGIARNRFVTSYGYALIYAGLRENEQALIWLRKAVEERSHWLVWIRVDPRFDALRRDPRFQQLAATVFPGS